MNIKTGRPTTLAFNGMVSTPHSLASVAGADVLRDGGTAIDAVIAANAVLTVLYPDQTSIGGDCFLMYFESSTQKLHGLNGSGRAPRMANRELLRTRYGGMPARGIDSVTVPGTIDCWATARDRFGRMEFDRLLAPAISYAREGFPVGGRVAEAIADVATESTWNQDLGPLFFANGVIPSVGSRMRLPELANSLTAIAEGGRDIFYTGSIAEAMLAASERLNGSFEAADLANHRTEWVEPITSTYRGTTIATMPPNSQGLTSLIELNMIELEATAEWGSADQLHRSIEAKKRAFQVRDTQLSDPSFVGVDSQMLVSKEFARALWHNYDPNIASVGTTLGAGDTVYLCAVDREGNAASMIQSIYRNFGSGVVADGTGIVLQCRGGYFSVDDDHPNRIEGGKRPLHTLMPGMLMESGELIGPIGAQGGDAQAQVMMQLVTNLIDYGMEPQLAIEMPRWVAGASSSGDPRTVTFERGFNESVLAELAARGHVIQQTGSWDVDFGHAQMILRDNESGLLRGGADPRADGAAIGI